MRALRRLKLQPDECRPGLPDALTAATLADCSHSDAVSVAKLLHQWAIRDAAVQYTAVIDKTAGYALVDRLSHLSLAALNPLYISYVLFALRIEFQEHPGSLIDKLLGQLECSFSQKQHCIMSVLSSLMTSLSRLSHMPSSSHGQVFLAYLTKSFEGLVPSDFTLNQVRVILFCCADLGVPVSHDLAWDIIHFCTSALDSCRIISKTFGICVSACMHLAYHVAVAGALDMTMLAHLVQTLHGRAGNLATFVSRNAVSETRVREINRALEYVEPGQGDNEQYGEWLQLKQLIPPLTAQPLIAWSNDRVSEDMLTLLQDNDMISSKPAQFGANHSLTCPRYSWQSALVIVNVHGAQDYFKNQPNR